MYGSTEYKLNQSASAASVLWSRVVDVMGDQDLNRVRGLLNILEGVEDAQPYTYQVPSFFYMPNLPDEPWLAPTRFPYVDTLREPWQTLRDEVSPLEDQTLQAPPYGLADDAPSDADPAPHNPPEWREWRLFSQNKPIPDRCAKFPNCARVAESIVQQSDCVQSISLLIMQPGGAINLHVDPTNYFVNVWLGLWTPARCGLEVAGSKKDLTPGSTLAFNNSYLHRAWNLGERPRVVFAVYDIHPDLTTRERQAVRIMKGM